MENKSWENVVTGKENAFAIKVLEKIAEEPPVERNYNFVFMYSKPGMGKSYLLEALKKSFRQKAPEKRVESTTASLFLEDMISHMLQNRMIQFQKKYTDEIDLLIIDDFQEFKNKDASQDQLINILNQLKQQGKDVVISCAMQPEELEGFNDRLVSRLYSGILIEIEPYGQETKRTILQKKCNELGLQLDSDIINSLSTKPTSDIRVLEAALRSIAEQEKGR